MEFTPMQKRVIETRGKNMLVSAAAGSGKTAVLVERIIRRITDSEDPADIDRMLIVTFTSAAASEMRERISLAIEERLLREPENEHLQRQAALLHNAQITTIDSFCLFVLRNHFHEIGLDPAFRVADEGEIRLMKQDVMEELLETCFAEGGDAFLALAESCSKSGSEKKLAERVLQLYEFAMSLPWPREWLAERKRDYRIGSVEELEESVFWREMLEEICLRFQDAASLAQEALALCRQPGGPFVYEAMLAEDAEALQDAVDRLAGRLAQAEEGSGAALHGSLALAGKLAAAVSFPALSRKRDERIEAEKRERVKALRGQVKDRVGAIRALCLSKSPQETLADMQEAAPLAESLIDVTLRFLERFAEKKREKNLIDFSDMEHLALEILIARDETGEHPTEAAAEYRACFEEIMIDEYQDSNLVQEALLVSISGEAQGVHNRFMVGDVKQSIYKFRLARPELFLEKYERYGAGSEPGSVRIDLKQNFRSRREVLESVNRVFARVMRREVGGIEYDADAALYPGAVYPEADADGQDAAAGQSGAAGQSAPLPSGGEDPWRTELLLYDRSAGEADADGQGAAAGQGAAEGRSARRSAREQEAAVIASRIHELVGHLPVQDRESGKLRPARYQDIVILLRAGSGWDDVFVRVLGKAGIPVYAASRTGYFAAQEIRTLLNFLRVIDNPRQDIPLFGVLRCRELSGGFSEEELALVRALTQEKEKADVTGDGTLYGRFCALEAAEGNGDESALPDGTLEKWRAFRGRLGRFRRMASYLPVGALLRAVLAESGYLYSVSAMPGGEQRRANVEMLLARAVAFEKTSYYGLFHFLRYMEQLERYEIDYGEAGILDENADTVRIMSIHKSKGLEFPICFVAGLGKRFNQTDAQEAQLLDVNLGLGIEAVDRGKRLRKNTLRRAAIASRRRRDNLGEELRILYVAMTRAREKLILTAAVSDAQGLLASAREAAAWEEELAWEEVMREPDVETAWEGAMQEPGVETAQEGATREPDRETAWGEAAQEQDRETTQEATAQDGFFSPLRHASCGALLSAGSAMDFLLPSLGDARAFAVRIWTAQELEGAAWERSAARSVRESRLELMRLVEENTPEGNARSSALRERFSFSYPHENLRNLYTKTTVSELKKAGWETEEGVARLYPEEEADLFSEEEDAARAFEGENADRATVGDDAARVPAGENAGGVSVGKDAARVSIKEDTARSLAEAVCAAPPENPILPRFLRGEQQPSGTDRGSAYHRVMELLPFTAFADAPPETWAALLEEHLNRLEQEGRLSAFFRGCVRPEKLLAFLRTPLARRMMRAQQGGVLFRERPFVLGIPASRMGADFPEEETVLVQGIIDAYFEEEGGLVVLDYKTDRVRHRRELEDRYRVQLEYYAEALERITEKKVRQKLLYSFALQEEIVL